MEDEKLENKKIPKKENKEKNQKKIKNKNIIKMTIAILILTLIISVIQNEQKIKVKNQPKTIPSSTEKLSNKKIEWGIKRNTEHKQPEILKKDREILEKNNGITLGNDTDKSIYITFDEGYEAGYTPQILATLKENNVKATFFLTAHFVNTQPDLVKQMIDEGHIIRKSYSKS